MPLAANNMYYFFITNVKTDITHFQIFLIKSKTFIIHKNNYIKV